MMRPVALRPAQPLLLTLLAFAAVPLAVSPALAKSLSAHIVTPGNAEVQAAIDRIQQDSNYQLQLPKMEPKPQMQMQMPDWLRALFNWLAGDGQWLVNAVFGLAIIAAVVFILYLTVPAVRDAIERFRGRFRRKSDDEPAEPLWQPDAAAVLGLLADADALAEQGRFGEAVHVLLNHSVTDIQRHRPDALRPAFTARAIALLDDLPEAARLAFGKIAVAVERSLWARRPIGQAEWADARAAYQDFAFGAHWRGARA